jgi:hypothetical protein
MKKALVAVASCLFMLNAEAKIAFCGYKDYFHLSEMSSPSIYIVGGYSEVDLYLEFVGPRSFILRDGGYCEAGYAHITLAYDATHWCVLDIKDGPSMNHPTIRPACNGLRYLDTTYDGTGSYSYTIHLE